MKRIIWLMTDTCNFRCSYCRANTKISRLVHRFRKDPDLMELAEQLNSFMEKNVGPWEVSLSGGEPMNVPGFVEICRKLAKNAILTIETNLSNDSVLDAFIELVPPERIYDVDISVHIEQREDRDDVNGLISRIKKLIEAGFGTHITYVLHPTLLNRYQRDQEYFAIHGIKIKPKAFKGMHNGVSYPSGYDASTKAIIDAAHQNMFPYPVNYQGSKCKAGINLFCLHKNGVFTRCPSDKKTIGQLPDVKILQEPLECNVVRCFCYGDELILKR